MRIWFHAQQVLVSKLVGIQRTAGNCWFCHHQLRTLPAAHLAPRSNSIPKQRAVTTTTTTTSTTLMVMTTSTIQPASYRFGKDIKFNPGVVCSENKKFSHPLSSIVKTFFFFVKKQFCVVPIWSGGRVVWYRSQIQTGFTLGVVSKVCRPALAFNFQTSTNWCKTWKRGKVSIRWYQRGDIKG